MNAPRAIFVFAAHGCGACDEYLPRFRYISAPHKNAIEMRIYDVATDPKAAAFASQLGVRATPTTIVMKDGRLQSHVGALQEAQIRQLVLDAIR